MKQIDASALDFEALGRALRAETEDVCLQGVCGQRFIAAGMSGKNIRIEGVPGNALGAYLNGGEITVFGNAQDAVGDTMNDGSILIHGSIGDAAGYAMRGGKLYVRGDAGYRAGIHMKEYQDKRPVMIIGGKCGSFLGEYQAGGTIIVLGLGDTPGRIVSNFPCTGMHGGRMFLRSDCSGIRFPQGVTPTRASADDLAEIEPQLRQFCAVFSLDLAEILDAPFTKIVPDSARPYKQLYVAN